MHDAPEILAQIAQHEDIKATIKSILEKSSILEHNENHANLYIFNKLQ
jgi:hypothetical protein